jgi:hypothetical protein
MLDRWSEGICAAGGAVVVLLAVERRIGPAAAGIARRIARPASTAPKLEPYLGFLCAAASTLLGVVAGLAVLAGLRRLGPRARAGAPVAVLAIAAALGAWRAHWLAYAAPLAVLALAPLLSVTRVAAVPIRWRGRREALACLASEAACLGVGMWLPFAATASALLLPTMLVPAMLAVTLGASRTDDDARWRCVCAGLPTLALPFAGLGRNPSLWPAVACAITAALAAWLLERFPGAGARAARWARVHAIGLAAPAFILVVVLPWHFRELGVADHAGHEGQHLGWINSILFGKLMMADAGFTYGPAREYALALVAWMLGGVTLEHVRLAHVVVNVVGLLCLFAAIRRVASGQLHLLLLGLVLLVTHSALVALVAYTTTYSFGWADASRAGLATLAVVVVLWRRRGDRRDRRRRLLGGGALAALATLYSHDFGLPAVLATATGLVLEVLVRRDGMRVRDRLRAALRDGALYAAGLASVLVPFLAVYAARGRLGALVRGYQWTMEVSNGSPYFTGKPWRVTLEDFGAYRTLTGESDPTATVGTRVLDYAIAPALPLLGLAHVVAAVVRRRVVQRTALVAALTVLGMMTLHHAFLAADPWHVVNASTPSLVLLVALISGARRLFARTRTGRAAPLGALAALALPALWLFNGAVVPVNARLARIASGEERPSVGDRFSYPDLPRAGDVQIGNEHLGLVRWVRANSWSDDPVVCWTWTLGGGTEAFLSQRRNPTSFDKPDEIVSPRQQRQVLAELEKDPPLLIVGHHFDEMGDDVRWFIQQGWHQVYDDSPGVQIRNK